MQVFGTILLSRNNILLFENESVTVTIVFDGQDLQKYSDGEKVVLTLRPQVDTEA